MSERKLAGPADQEGWSLERTGRTPGDEHREFCESFERAWAAHPGLRRSSVFRFADRPARLRILGVDLAETTERAFEHLRVDSVDVESVGEPELTIDLWDEEATGVGVSGLCPGPDLNADGQVFVSDDGRFVVTARTQTRTASDRSTRRIVGWVGTAEDLTQHEIGRPLQSELILWHRDRGARAVHAGLVARHGDGVLFGGPGGAGKTTTALTSLKAGFEYLADDYVALERQDGDVFVGHSLYASSHLEPHHIQRFPYLLPHALPGRLEREDKHLVMLSRVLPEGLGRKARVRAVALPRVVDSEDTSFEPASTIEAMLRLAPSSLLLFPFTGIVEKDFDALGEFLRLVPTYWLNLGRDLEQIPVRIGEILEKHR